MLKSEPQFFLTFFLTDRLAEVNKPNEEVHVKTSRHGSLRQGIVFYLKTSGNRLTLLYLLKSYEQRQFKRTVMWS